MVDHTDYLFIYNGANISWRHVKQTIPVTLFNHEETFKFLTLHEASRECVWLRFLFNTHKRLAVNKYNNHI